MSSPANWDPDVSQQLALGVGAGSTISGDVGGALPGPTTVTGIGGVPVDPPDGVATDYLNGQGHWTTPAGGASGTPDWVNVKDHGAVGDGTADDTAAINAAIGAIGSAGGVLYFPVGTYKITSTLSFTSGTSITLQGDPSVYGDTGGSIISMATLNTTAISQPNNDGTGLRIRDLKIVGPGGSPSSGKGVYLFLQGYVEHCEVRGFYQGIYFDYHNYYGHIVRTRATANTYAGIFLAGTNNTTIDDCAINYAGATCQYGVVIVGSLNSRVLNSSIEGFSVCGIEIEGNSVTNPVSLATSIKNCYFEQNGSSGHIVIGPNYHVHSTTIESCYFQGSHVATSWAIQGNLCDTLAIIGCDIGYTYDASNTMGAISGSANAASFLLLGNNIQSGTVTMPTNSVRWDAVAGWSTGGFTAGGDLTGTSTSQTVAKINGSPLGTLSPALADRLRWNGSAWVNSALRWTPVTVFDPTTGNYLPLVDGDGNQIMTEV